MITIAQWTGRETKAFRLALRLSIRDFADRLDVGVRTVARWEARGASIAPAPDSQGLLDTALSRASVDEKERLAAALALTERSVFSSAEPPASLLSVTNSAVPLPMMRDSRPISALLGAATLSASGLGGFLGNAPGVRSAGTSVAAEVEADAMSPLDRRAFIKAGIGVGLWSALNPDEQAHVVAALDAPQRNLDTSVIGYFERQLGTYMTDDGNQGPGRTLPAVLGLLAAIDQCARDVQPEVRRQLLSVAARIAEFAGWLYRDVHDPLQATYWRDRATEWAQEAGDTAMQGYVLLKKAQAAYDERDALRMLTLSQAVRTGPWQLPTRVQAEAAQQEARGHAMLGHDQAVVERNLDEAEQLLTGAAVDDEHQTLGAHYNATLLKMQTAICHTEAGKPRQAADLYRQWLLDEDFSPRDYGYFSSLMASALALAGEPDEAARVGIMAWPLAMDTDSGRTKAELQNVLATLQPWHARAAVRELRDALRV